MATRLYVGNLPYSISEQELNDLFAAHGKVISTTIIKDRYSGRSKGFGFVEFENDEEAQNAIQNINGTAVGDRKLVVSVARPREERPARPYSENRDFGRDKRSFDDNKGRGGRGQGRR